MTDRVAGITVKRCGDCRIETIKSSLPLRPKPIDISMKKKEKWISRGCRNARDETPEARVCKFVRVPFQVLKTSVSITKGERLRLSHTARGISSSIKEWTTVDPRNSICHQNCSGLLALKLTVPNWSETPMKSGVNKLGAAWSKRQYGSATLESIACNSRSRSSR